VPKRIEGGDAGTHERRPLDRGQPFRNSRQRRHRSHHILRVAAVKRDAGHLSGRASEKIASATRITAKAMTGMPAHSHALAWLPVADVGADGVNDPKHLVPGNSWILNPRKHSFLDNRVAVTDATSLDFDSDRPRRRLRDFPFREFQRPLPASDLNDTHLR